MRLEHIALNVAEPEKVMQWYQDHLHMQVVSVSQTPTFAAYFLSDSVRQSVLEFYHNPVAPVPDYAAIPPANLHIAFSADDPEADRDRLVAAGGTAEGQKVTFPSGAAFCYVRDPWGLTLQLVKRPEALLK